MYAYKDQLEVRNIVARLVLSASFVLCSGAISSAQTPAPAPKATPAPATNTVKFSGVVRGFYFTRSNAVNCDTIAPSLPAKPGTTGIPCNAQAGSLGGKFHADYQFAQTPWSLGATYFGALSGSPSSRGFDPRVDNSLPGYNVSVMGEAYLQYKNKYTTGQIGREVINTPWANPSDSRIVPVSFQGAWLSGAVTPTVTVGAYYMGRFRHRTASAFYNDTLLTSCSQQTPVVYFLPEPPAAKTPIAGADPCALPAAQSGTKGFALLQITKKFNPTWVANLYQYKVYDVVNITHIDTKNNFAPKSPLNPYFAAQYIAESDTGRALVGTIKAHMYGMQMGASFGKNIDVAASFNQSGQQAFITTNCTSSPGGVFGGVKGATVPGGAPAGTTLCYGGGIASPYTDSYATDPLYTTTISQGLADVRKPGSAMKLALTFQTNNKRFKAILAGAQYYYGLPAASLANQLDQRKELNVDMQYFFSAVDSKKPYKGFSLRHRYADRFT
ncbi:MAG: OprD family outer membrane porin, partial [Candidatus Eremiobacteraeota bacterium]|nr:OprD family outer membrane porin [Candidatus Eremiobacteraeota bacterium]